MSIIPGFVIENWYKQYDADSELWVQYPDVQKGKSGLIQTLAERDRGIVKDVCLGSSKPVTDGKKPVYVATAGAPLAGKSTVLEQEIEANPERYSNLAKVDPDRYGMSFMVHTYHNYLMSAGMIADAESFEAAQQRAYDVARPASNFLTLEIFNVAAQSKCNIAHGTTMTSPHAAGLLQSLRNNGYEIDLLLCNAEDEMRADAQQYRASVQGHYQSTPEDVINKGIEFPKRMEDYFTLADNLSVFWRDGVTEDAVKAAVYSQGRMEVLDQEAYERFVNKYEIDRYRLEQSEGLELASFSDLESLYARRFAEQPKAKPQPAPKP